MFRCPYTMSFSATEARKNSPCAFIGPPNVIECPINSLFFFSNCLSCKVLFEYMIQTHNRILYSILTKLTQKTFAIFNATKTTCYQKDTTLRVCSLAIFRILTSTSSFLFSIYGGKGKTYKHKEASIFTCMHITL